MLGNSKSSDDTHNDNQINEKVISSKIDRSMLIECFQQNDFIKAESIASILLDRAKETFGAESVETWGASMEYIEVQKRLKNDKIALKLYLELEPLTIKLFGDDHENSASVFNNIAMLYYHTFQHSQTIPYFKKTLAIWEKRYPENDQRVVMTRNNIFVNQQMAYFDVQSQKHCVKIEKMDFTRDLHGRKPQNDEKNNDDDFKNDPKRMAAFQEAIDDRFNGNDDDDKSNNNISNNNKSTQQKDVINNKSNVQQKKTDPKD